MSVCPGCGRCRECGHRASPRPIYPWFGPYPYPYVPTVPWPNYPQPYIGDPMPWQQGTVTITSTAGGNY